MTPREPELRLKLLAMRDRDLETRARLAADGSLFEGYHPEMQALHEENASSLAAILDGQGWPGIGAVGEDGAEAAWLIAQHAISRPAFCRRCLEALRLAAEAGEAPAWQPAYLEDRIRSFEGRPQLYGTSFDWDEQGRLNPLPIEEPGSVDARRAAVGLGPLSDATERHRQESASEPRPEDLEQRKADLASWARSVGWR